MLFPPPLLLHPLGGGGAPNFNLAYSEVWEGLSGTSRGTAGYTTELFSPAANTTMVVTVMAQASTPTLEDVSAAISITGGSLSFLPANRVTWNQNSSFNAWSFGAAVFHVKIGSTAPGPISLFVTAGETIHIHKYKVHVVQITQDVGLLAVGGTGTYQDPTLTLPIAQPMIPLSEAPNAQSLVLALMTLGGSPDTAINTGPGYAELWNVTSEWFRAHIQAKLGNAAQLVTWGDVSSAYTHLGAVGLATEFRPYLP